MDAQHGFQQLFVELVARGGLAERAGMQAFDRIEFIGGDDARLMVPLRTRTPFMNREENQMLLCLAHINALFLCVDADTGHTGHHTLRQRTRPRGGALAWRPTASAAAAAAGRPAAVWTVCSWRAEHGLRNWADGAVAATRAAGNAAIHAESYARHAADGVLLRASALLTGEQFQQVEQRASATTTAAAAAGVRE